MVDVLFQPVPHNTAALLMPHLRRIRALSMVAGSIPLLAQKIKAH
jgi:hypothetical protein